MATLYDNPSLNANHSLQQLYQNSQDMVKDHQLTYFYPYLD